MPAQTQSKFSAATVAGVADTASSATIAAANEGRAGCWIFNDSTEILYIKMGATASIASGGYSVKIAAGGFWEMPTTNGVYTGVIDGIWANNASGFAQVTQF